MAASRYSRPLSRAVIRISAIACMGAIGIGCDDRFDVPLPHPTDAIYPEPTRQAHVDKVDLLFMVDNSPSMADKQGILAEAVPYLLSRLTSPACFAKIGPEERHVERDADGSCPEGSQPEFQPINDIHIGIISSSLGANGADSCKPSSLAFVNDRAHLLARGQDGTRIATYEGKGFLQWDPASEKSPASEIDREVSSATFAEMILGVGETGCRYEQSLEAVYRFLVDPEPYKAVELVSEEGRSTPYADLVDIDETLLQQRADFLRPDSLVVIVSLSDENDCSTIAGDRWYLSLDSSYGLPRATSACADDPNDECCVPCTRGWAPFDCTPIADDPACLPNKGRYDPNTDTRENLRCFDQKRRFGVDFLYPVDRYIEGIRNRVVPNRQGDMVTNPLFLDLQCNGEDCKPERDDSLIVWAMIIGVPWQDIAKDPTDLSKGYLTSSELVDRGRWEVVLGSPSASPPVSPTDPLMIESVHARSGEHPLLGERMVMPDIENPPPRNANTMNGHERRIGDGDDLQYACIFDLLEPRKDQGAVGQDCYESASSQNPLCQDPETQDFGATQFAAKAYPGARHLQVAKGLGDQAVVASICPAQLLDAKAPDYGYRPAIDALVHRLTQSLGARRLDPNVGAASAMGGPAGEAVHEGAGDNLVAAREGVLPP